MTTLTARAPLEASDRWRLRLLATAAALALGAAIFFLQRMPAAEALSGSDAQLTATSTQALALYNLRPAPVMQYDGAPGAGLRLSASAARLAPATRANLTALGLSVPNVKGGRLQWQGRPGAEGRVSVRIRSERQAPDAGLMLRPTGSGNVAELGIRTVQNVLTVQIDLVTQGDGEAPVSELTFAEARLDDPALSFAPLSFEVPPGETMNLAFDSIEALESSTFRLGELLETGGSATVLSVGRAEVGRPTGRSSYPDLRSVLRGVCASSPGRLLFSGFYPDTRTCALGETADADNLFANDIRIEPRSVILSLEGSGFVVTNGRARPAALWSALMGNPLIAALMGALVYAVARPLWRLWVGRGM